jgi:cysteine-rich repeat protein
MRTLLASILLAVAAPFAHAAVYTVAESGGDFTTIQAALDTATAGDTVQVQEKATPYFEKLTFPASGSAGGGYITLEASAGHAPVLDGSGVTGANMVLIDSRSYVKLVGFEIRNHLGVNDGSGVRIIGSGSHIEIRNNRIHDVRGDDAMGITVYGTEATPISDLIIDGNEIHDCEPARSEALTLNGNVSDFAVTNNIVRDVNNIGIDFIGGETDIQPDATKVARDGVCRGNQVHRANASYGGGFAAGIYVDGGRDIVIENNVVSGSDLGIEVGAENPGTVTTGIIVRNNVLYGNEKVGIVFGGFAASVGRVRDCRFLNNSLFGNDTLGEGLGELWIQYAENNEIRNNIFYGTDQNVLLYSDAGNLGNVLDYNLWYLDAGSSAAVFEWNGTVYEGFAAYRAGTGQDATSPFGDPLYASTPGTDFHIAVGSPAINAGDPAFVPDPGELDLDGGTRVNGPRVDIGADEMATCGNGTAEVPELCDDADLDDGDGCDSNCTPTGCGNGIVTIGEECDDGNAADGDCCGASCLHEAAGSPCDDGNPCTTPDTCVVGLCTGTAAPASSCREAGRGTLRLRDRDPDARDAITWKWTRGAATMAADLGDPVDGTTSYALCIYDGSGGVPDLAMQTSIPASGTCGGKPCWIAAAGGRDGYRYRDSDGGAGGLTKMLLRPGEEGKAKIILTGRGTNLPLPELPLAQDSTVTIQLRNSAGGCWGTSYAAPAAQNTDEQFKDTHKASN